MSMEHCATHDAQEHKATPVSAEEDALDLDREARAVCESLLGMDAVPLDPESDEAAIVGKQTAGLIQVGGGWLGMVVVRAGDELSRAVAASMFANDDNPDGADLEENDVRDAMGELVNVIGGRVKPPLPDLIMSLPMVITSEAAPYLPMAKVLSSGVYACNGKPLSIAVYQAKLR